ncbi:MAG: diadenylate cyclase CdaA [Bacteriovoracaceae bacterium]|nr:diadenylate cyclase CdaA [Bacteriovoracaceae bacterium]
MKDLLPFLQNLRALDLLDILAVSFIIYRMLLIVQGTRAVQMLLGLGAMAALWWASNAYELHALSWLLQLFFDYLFILIIVLFQDQIKSALVSFGGTRFIGRASKGSLDQQIEEVVSACMSLSRERTGALIVFEKNHGLLNYSLTGTRLDARVHSDVLYALFQTRSPLHDGAVILFDGKIQSAGCFLPLSKSGDVDRHFGTRHRAALGISEVSDAVVVVVSEETGKIQICFNGEFSQAVDENSLRKGLRQRLLRFERGLQDPITSFGAHS